MKQNESTHTHTHTGKMNKRKITTIIALVLCMILAFSSTFAYLTASDNEINTVTIGKVEIDVVEDLWSQLPDTDGDGIPDAAEAVIPNQSVTKDPSIKNTGNNEAYVYLSVEVPNKNITSFNPDGTPANGGAATDTDLFNYKINDGWTLIGSKTEAGKTIYTYGYEEKLAVGAETPTLFDKVTVVNTSEGQGFEETVQDIVINGYAIQSDNVGDLLNAWNIINNQANLGTTAISNLLIPGPDFNATIPAAATKVAFVDDTAPAAYTFDNGKLLDVSDAQDKGVVAWYDEANTTYYVSTQRDGLETLANADSSYTFANKTALKNVDFNGLDTQNATTMESYFYKCTGIESMDIHMLDTRNVTTMKSFFNSCSNLKDVNLKSINTDKLETTYEMFSRCASLEEFDFEGFDLSNVKDMEAMFNRCSSLKDVDMTHFKADSAKNLSYLFSRCSSLTTIDMTPVDTYSCENMSFMFNNCTSLSNADISELDLSNTKNMRAMFQNCYALTYLNVSEWDMRNVSDLGYAFYKTGLTSLDVTNWQTDNLTDLCHTFCHCSSLTSLDPSGWNTSKVVTLDATFENVMVSSLDLSEWDTSSCLNFGQTFESMDNLTELKGLENWDTSKGKTFHQMLAGNYKLKELNLSSFDTRNADGSWIDPNHDAAVWNGLEMKDFILYEGETYLPNLEKIHISKNISLNGDGSEGNFTGKFPKSSTGYWYNIETGEAFETIPEGISATYVSTQP